MTDTTCDKCHNLKQPATCWYCAGAGGFHDCGDDTCCCLDTEEIHNDCEICDGAGEYMLCPVCHPESFDDY